MPAQHHQESITSRGAAGKRPLCCHLIKETSKWLQRHFITTLPAGPISGCPSGGAGGCSPGCGTPMGAKPLPSIFRAKKAGCGFAHPGIKAAVVFGCGSWTCAQTRRGGSAPHSPAALAGSGTRVGSPARRRDVLSESQGLPGQITSNNAIIREAPAHGCSRGVQGTLLPEPSRCSPGQGPASAPHASGTQSGVSAGGCPRPSGAAGPGCGHTVGQGGLHPSPSDARQPGAYLLRAGQGCGGTIPPAGHCHLRPGLSGACFPSLS